ncbi:SDR family NAD(P)-dependent oxidoreductase [Agarilytica rhodophyticola]|uniref:SDR family NAD(P)-dependent oxidoreductase n=1 Tax=Agarilytica rhodophyticola TaxID=1737490 RepID=UPI000B3472AC|nr:SDR family NAD(P)-dependent oxidoreductase [Agarilytica rhodophyticola]
MTKTILITGASSGFGEACARKYAQHGYTLILGARSIDKLEALKNELGATNIFVAALDVCQANSIDDFFNSIPEAYQNIDIVINNAGLALGLEPAYEANLDDWETMINTNIMGLVRVTRKVIPGMVERNRGHVINIGSVAGSWAYPGGNVYGSTKSFVQQFSRNLRADLLGKHVRVTNIEPGLSETNFSVVRMKGDQEKAANVYEGTKPLSAEDIADIVFWTSTVPEHVNINALEVMPTCQAWGPFSINRDMQN